MRNSFYHQNPIIWLILSLAFLMKPLVGVGQIPGEKLVFGIEADTVIAKKMIENLSRLIATKAYDSVLLEGKKVEYELKSQGFDTSFYQADAYHNQGLALYYQDSIGLAMRYYQKALAIRKVLEIKPSATTAVLYQNLGWNYFDLKQYEKAVVHFKKAWDIRVELYPAGHLDTYYSIQGLAYSYYTMRPMVKGIRYEIIGLELLEKLDTVDQKILLDAYTEVIHDLYQIGDFQGVINFSLRAVERLEQEPEVNKKVIADLYHDLAYYLSNFDAERSKLYYYEANRRYQSLPSPDSLGIVTSYSGLGSVYSREDDYIEGNYFFELALSYVTVLRTDTNLWAGILHDYGHQLMHQAQYDKARPLLYKAKDLLASSVQDLWEMKAYVIQSLGICDELEGKFRRAVRQYQEVCNLHAEKRPDEVYYNKLEALRLLADGYSGLEEWEMADSLYHAVIKTAPHTDHYDLTLAIKADAYVSLGKLYGKRKGKEAYLKKAMLYYDTAFALVDSSIALKHAFNDSGLNLFHGGYNFSTYVEDAVDVAVGDGTAASIRKAYEFSNRYRAYNLTSGLQLALARELSILPDSLRFALRTHSLQITEYKKKRDQLVLKGLANEDSLVMVLNNQLLDEETQLEQLKKSLLQHYPTFGRSNEIGRQITARELQQAILPSETMIEYMLGDSSIFVFIIRRETIDVIEIARDFPLQKWVDQLQTSLVRYYGVSMTERTDDLYKSSLREYIEISQALYSKLIEPVIDYIQDSSIIIIPDGILYNIPFGALLEAPPGRITNFMTYPFLERKYQISYAYSGTLWAQMKQKQHSQLPQKSVLALAPFAKKGLAKEVLAVDTDKTTIQPRPASVNPRLRNTMTRLPASGEEVMAVSKVWEGDYFLDTLATEALFDELAPQYRILHLSTHGTANRRLGDYSYLAFAEVKDSVENELLFVADLYNTRLNADLVVLSACETAAGELQRGEGVISLARAFTYAGAKALVTTLWVADDEVTKGLMVSFHQHLKEGMDKAQALQRSKLEILNSPSYFHPFFWASFIAVGDMRPLR